MKKKFLFQFVLFFSVIGFGVCSVISDSTALTSGLKKGVVVQYKDKHLTVKADKVPFKVLLDKISEATGIQFKFKDHSCMDELMSINVNHMDIDSGLRKILRGYSYVEIYSKQDKKKPIITILGIKGVKRDINDVSKGKNKLGLSKRALKRQKAGNSLKPVKLSEELKPVEEWQFLVPNSDANDGLDENGQLKDPNALNKEAYEAARIKRAEKLLDQLNVGDDRPAQISAVHQEAINDLANMRDNPNAKQMLIKISTGADRNVPSEIRQQAVRKIWGLAGDSRFQDPALTETLQRLTNDPDPTVSSIAQQAVQDMEHYNRRQEVVSSIR